VETEEGRRLVLRDGGGISRHVLAVPPLLAPVLALCDGTRTLEELRTAATLRLRHAISAEQIAEVVETLDEALFLDNARYREARNEQLSAYRSADTRPPSHAGVVYPAERDALSRYLGAFKAHREAADAPEGRLRAILSPHIDYHRGGSVYRALWERAAPRLGDVRRVILVATDHQGAAGTFTSTRQHYRTPFGTVPTDLEAVDRLEAAAGPALFDGELRHAAEHSIELVLVWLQWAIEERPVELVPLLCGGLHHLFDGPGLLEDPRTLAVVDALRCLADEDGTLIVASGDLAHVGPAFGGSEPYRGAKRSQLGVADAATMGHLERGDAMSFYEVLRSESDVRNYCGLSPFTLAILAAGDVIGRVTAYAQCDADARGDSLVSVAGMLLVAA
jgi:hypothetical protein